MKTLPKPYPPGPLGPNPDNDTVRSAGEAVEPEPHHAAVHAVSRADRLVELHRQLKWARIRHEDERAEQLLAAIKELDREPPQQG
jgi:hypothetical protein